MISLEIDSGALPLLSLLGKILNLIHIAIPILLIVFVTIDLGKAVLSQDDEQISRTVRSIKNRVIACIAIFLLPTLIESFFYKTFVSLNMDVDEYQDIIASYKAVINSENIEVQDDTKNQAISGDLLYSISDSSTDKKQILKTEQEFANYTKTLTDYILKGDYPISILKNICSDDFTINYNNKNYTLDDKLEVIYDSMNVSSINVDNDIIVSNVSLKNVSINEKTKYNEVIVSYYFSKEDNKTKLNKISINEKNIISDYLDELKTNEKPDEIIGSGKYVSNDNDYDYSKLNSLSKDKISKIYTNNEKNIVMLNTISYSAVVNRATGFFISDGIIATSWSYFQNSLMKGQTIIVSDIDNNSYKPSGIVAMDTTNDIVVIKLNKEVKRSVNFGDKDLLTKNDPVISISSKTGTGFTTVSGIISSNSDNIVSVLPLEKNDWGSPLFNINGEVVGINTSKITNSELSSASSIKKLETLQRDLKSREFNKIKSTPLEDVKKKYYYQDQNKEKIITSLPDKIWGEYKEIGNIEESIVLDLVKASYYENIVSLRYENKTSSYIDTLSYANDFISNLTKAGYKKVSHTKEKLMYTKGFDKVIIMEEFDYLIVILVKENLI